MSKKAIAIIVAAILVASGLLAWGGTRLATAQVVEQSRVMQVQLISLESDLSRMQMEYGNLQQGNTALRAQLTSAEGELSRLQSEYGNLQQANNAVRTQVASTQGELVRVQLENVNLQQTGATLRTQLASAQADLLRQQSEYANLQQKSAATQSQLASVTADYTSLMTRYDSLEKARAFTVDDRLKVSLYTEAQLPTVAWIRGEVTNTGNAPAQRVYVLVFRYKADGSLDKLDLPPTVLLNIAPGATGYFSFMSAGETTKIMVAGDY